MSTPRTAAALLVALWTANTVVAPPGFAQQAADDDPPPPPAEARVSGTAPAASDPTDVFVPTEKIGAGAVVAFPVDI